MTSIEWLNKKLEEYGDPQFCELKWKELDKLIEQAKELHKQEITDAWDLSRRDIDYNADGKKYYETKYGEKD